MHNHLRTAFMLAILCSATVMQAQKPVTITLPPQDNVALLKAEQEAQQPGRPLHFAEPIATDISPATHGEWKELDNCIAQWTIAISSPGALTLNFGFNPFYLPSGSTLNLSSAITGNYIRPITEVDNEAHGQFWSPVIDGDMAMIDVKVPSDQKDNLQLKLIQVGHDFMGFGNAGAVVSGSCNLDVICGTDDGWPEVEPHRDIIQSAGLYSLNGSMTCSGALINNINDDCTPYFLTANHCGVSSGNAPSMVGFWNFQNSTCRQPNSTASGGNGNGVLTQFTSGATLRAQYSPSDMVLVEFDDPIDAEFNPYFAGWDRSADVHTSAIAVHHPNLDEKRISFDDDPGQISAFGGGGANTHHQVIDWNIGTTEPGSSGSPLFNQEERIIGQLHGGGAACGNDASDWYGRVFTSWEGGGSAGSRLKDWLDPNDTGAMFMDGKNCAYFVQPSISQAEACAGSTSMIDFTAGETFSGTVDLSVSGAPAGVTLTLSSNTTTSGGTVTGTLVIDAGVASGMYAITVAGDDGTNQGEGTVVVTISNGVAAPNYIAPANGATDISIAPALDFSTETGSEYEVQLASDAAFTDIVGSTTGNTTGSFSAANSLEIGTQYFWRVRASNACGDSDWGAVFSFTTSADFACATNMSANVPVEISSGPANTITSTLEIPEATNISDINVIDVVGDHTWINDLSMTLTSPEGTTVQLLAQSCDNEDNFNLSFDDSGEATLPCPFNDGGSYLPAEALSAFNGENSQGTWTLEVMDNAGQDGGSLNGWGLEVCGTPFSVEEIEATLFSLFPNPSNGELNVRLDQPAAQGSKLSVFDSQGKLIAVENIPAGKQRHQINLQGLSKGMYTVQLQLNTTVQTQRWVVR